MSTELKPNSIAEVRCAASNQAPSLSVLILNYNGIIWMEKCLASLKAQTIFADIEVIVADNKSTDGSDVLSEKLLADWTNGKFVQNGANYGFCEGNNLGAIQAKGEFILFLNNDTWMEPDSLEKLLKAAHRLGATAANPLILNYPDNSFQSLGASGFDVFGLATCRLPHEDDRPVFMPEGCAYLIKRDCFVKLGGFDKEFFMFVDEFDLSWRVWLSGGDAFAIPSTQIHHRGAANVNPQGGGQVVEMRTSDTKRFYANRNSLLAVLKNAKNFLLLLAAMQLLLLALEALAALILVRRWSFVRNAYVKAVLDCWRLRGHVFAERRKNALIRKRGDFAMLRFLRLRPNRWDEFVRMLKSGVPKVTAK